MTITAPIRRPAVAARRVGYVIAAAINVAMLIAVNGWPGWAAVPFLTDDTTRVLGLVNLTLAANLAVNIVYLAADPPWLKALGELTTTVVGLAATVWILRVFPFDFTGYAVDWAPLVRGALIVGVVGASIAAIIQFGTLIRRLVGLSTKEQGS